MSHRKRRVIHPLRSLDPHSRRSLIHLSLRIVFPKILTVLLFCLVGIPAFGPNVLGALQEIQNEDCLTCHDKIAPEKYAHSIHGKNLCTSCHADIREIPHQDKPAPVQCANCHALESQIYRASDHGIAVGAGISAAGCLDCHGEPHSLLNYRNPESPVYRLNIPKTCARCHEDRKKMSKFSLSESAPLKSYSESVHGKALMEKGLINAAMCTDCHGSHDLHAPTNPKSKIYWLNVPSTCGKCHENVLQTYRRSIHGKGAMEGKRESPVCTDCHGEHGIKSHLDPTSSVYATVISEKTCGRCHESEKLNTKFNLPADRVSSYFESYHGMASKLGVTTVANCASCHGAHDVLPSSDPDSSVNKAHLSRTCGKCHPGAGKQLAMGSVHGTPSPKENHIVYYVTLLYIGLIIVVIGGMLAHNALDFLKKLIKHYRELKDKSHYLRFTVAERIQHFILSTTFIVLAYTGFALKFPDAWWNFPFMIVKSNTDWRGVIHKGAAIVFVLLGLYHVWFVIWTRRGRQQIKELLPRWRDFKDVFTQQIYNLGFSKERPKFAPYSYIEKAEYWALLWGSVVMILTGAVLTFENFFMQYLPKWALDLATAIHFYEALLAVLAILVWHFYFVIFDPETYPMNPAMMTGKVPEEEKAIEEPSKEDPPKEKNPE